MDRYQRVVKPRPESTINENEIRITTQGLIRNYISYATTLLQDKQVREIVLKAMGQAISKAVAIAEIIKAFTCKQQKRIPALHQDTTTSSTSITDVWEPIEEGLIPLETTRHVSMISITLSTKELNKNNPGYQAPSNVEPPKPQHRYYQQQYWQQHQSKQEPAPTTGVIEEADMRAIKKMMVIGTGDKEVDEAEAGAIVVLDMKERLVDMKEGEEEVVEVEAVEVFLQVLDMKEREVDMKEGEGEGEVEVEVEVVEVFLQVLDMKEREVEVVEVFLQVLDMKEGEVEVEVEVVEVFLQVLDMKEREVEAVEVFLQVLDMKEGEVEAVEVFLQVLDMKEREVDMKEGEVEAVEVFLQVLDMKEGEVEAVEILLQLSIVLFIFLYDIDLGRLVLFVAFLLAKSK
ncbi:hypothetical protein HHK36_022390 [Tetracentron sinense]|uniref:DNA/RNA-binding protein Alba-like domain-containing protein n=1 Tax=Tetracentron sinense TaxID=13715 RepID=A0A834YQT2_TETSI|nr:hypothetical protein HHK36_022390 [Tetracentron sinense]